MPHQIVKSSTLCKNKAKDLERLKGMKLLNTAPENENDWPEFNVSSLMEVCLTGKEKDKWMLIHDKTG